MGVTLPGSRPYVVIRLAAWSILFIGVLVDAILHRSVRRRGWQLHWTILAVIFFYVVQDVLLTTVSFEDIAEQGSLADRIFYAFLFFTDFADSLFIALLLLIAGGFGITRDNFGPYFKKMTFIPLGYFITSLIVDTVIYAVNGRRAFRLDTTEVSVASLDDWQIIVLFVCQLCSLAALLLSWIYVFDLLSRERELLESSQEGIVGVAPAADVELGRRRSSRQANGETTGHAVNVPDEVLLQANDSHQVGNYANMSGNDTDQPKTVVERLDHRSKVQLMKHFIWGVTAYVLATAAVILVPLFVAPTDPQSATDTTATFVVLVGQDCVLWLFLAVLSFIFRPRADNPYLMLDEDRDTNIMTGLDDDDLEPHRATEMVPSRPSQHSVQERSRSPTKGRGAAAAESAPRHSIGTPTSIDHNFTLGNEDEELEASTSSPVQMTRTASKPGSSPKAAAAPRPKPVKERKD